MAKSNVISKTKQKVDQANYRAMRFFGGGCLAEAFLLVIRNYYVTGTANQVVAWDGYMYPMAIVGALVAILGLAGLLTKGKTNSVHKEVSLWVLCGGAYVAVIGALVRTLYTSLLTPMLVTVPVAMLLGILWCLYSSECAIAISTVGVSLVVIWIGRKILYHLTLGTLAHVGLGVYVVLLAVVAYGTYQLASGKKKCSCGLVKAKSDVRGIYIACASSALAVVINLISTVVGYYAIWLLIAVAFVLGVYYTVREL
ncbi:hypothetical protein RFF05_08835 [Bengtsoniella intestinalis]|uniref:hypothetical protein n=1 Tax=Bengtsoniella intestinalis TaxID=3073143 RepID=UPI00391F2072